MAPRCTTVCFVAVAVAALALAATIPAVEAIDYPYPAPLCRTGTAACPRGCCTDACPAGSAGDAVPNGIPGLSATIKGLTYDPKTALVMGTLVMTNTNKTPVDGLIAEVELLPGGGVSSMWCGGDKRKTLAPGASRACPFAIVGGVDPAKFDWTKAASREPQPGVDAGALKRALAFSTSDVVQTPELKRGLKPSAVSATAALRSGETFPQPGIGGFICWSAFTPATAAKAN